MPETLIETYNLVKQVKQYGKFMAFNNISFDMRGVEVFGRLKSAPSQTSPKSKGGFGGGEVFVGQKAPNQHIPEIFWWLSSSER